MPSLLSAQIRTPAGSLDKIPVDGKPYYLLGRYRRHPGSMSLAFPRTEGSIALIHPSHLSSPPTHRAADQVDICLDDASCSRVHAALVHHQDGRIFLIDLHSVRREGSGCHASMWRLTIQAHGYPPNLASVAAHACSMRMPCAGMHTLCRPHVPLTAYCVPAMHYFWNHPG